MIWYIVSATLGAYLCWEILWFHKKNHLNLNKLAFEDCEIRFIAYLKSSLMDYDFERGPETPQLNIHDFPTKYNLTYLFCLLLFPTIPQLFEEFFCLVLCPELEYTSVIPIRFCFQGFCQGLILVLEDFSLNVLST